MKTLEAKLGYHFQNPALLEHALTHSSYANEHHLGSISSNERLEFLGDSVLGMIVADYLYRTFPSLPEGDLTRIRANLVCENSLVLVAKALDLGRYLKLGKGENACGGRNRPSILADAVEALLAAVFLDGGLAYDRDIIQRFILDHMDQVNQASRDHKTYLQDWSSRKSRRAHLSVGGCVRPGSQQNLYYACSAQRRRHWTGLRPQQKRGGTGSRQRCHSAPGACRIVDCTESC